MDRRRKPIQQRSRATVDAILEAAAHVLRTEGWARFSTNRVARRAGVNIGSVYQYFADKEAVIHELHRRFREEVKARVRAAGPVDGSFAGFIRLGVVQALATLAVNPEMHRVFLEELPPAIRDAHPIDPEAIEQFRAYARERMVGVPDPELALWIWDEVLDGLARSACAKRPELLSDPRFADELTVLLQRYLIRPDEPRPSGC